MPLDWQECRRERAALAGRPVTFAWRRSFSLRWFLEALFGGGTEIAVGAESAIETRFGIKLSRRDICRDFSDPAPGFIQVENLCAG